MSRPCEKYTTSTQNRIAFNTWADTAQVSLDRIKGLTSDTEAVAALDSQEDTVNGMVQCIRAKAFTQAGLTNSIVTAQQEMNDLTAKIAENEEAANIAKDRIKYVSDSGRPVSYYESWFPLGRPIKAYIIPILFGVSIFFTATLILSVLSLVGGVQFKMERTVSKEGGTFALLFAYLKSIGLTVPFWLVLAALIGVLVYFLK